MNHGTLPLVNACLNGLAAFLLLLGFVFVRRRQLSAHRACMLSAFAVSVVFLGLYLYHKVVVVKGVNTPFPGPASAKPWYLAMLFSHIVLAIAVVPMALVTIHRGLRERLDQHRKIARWTWPIWMYVSVTGVCVYLALYVVWSR